MANTLTKIASISTYGVSFYEFTSIPATYTDLVIMASLRTNTADVHEGIELNFNGLTTNRSDRRIYGYQSTAYTDTGSVMYAGRASAASNTANCFGSLIVYITNYATTKVKMSHGWGGSQSNSTQKLMDMSVNAWNAATTITSIKLVPDSGGIIQQYSTADLYGIKSS